MHPILVCTDPSIDYWTSDNSISSHRIVESNLSHPIKTVYPIRIYAIVSLALRFVKYSFIVGVCIPHGIWCMVHGAWCITRNGYPSVC